MHVLSSSLYAYIYVHAASLFVEKHARYTHHVSCCCQTQKKTQQQCLQTEKCKTLALSSYTGLHVLQRNRKHCPFLVMLFYTVIG